MRALKVPAYRETDLKLERQDEEGLGLIALKRLYEFVRVFFSVSSLLTRLTWSPALWKTLYLWRTHLRSAARSHYVPQVHYAQDGEDIALLELLPTQGFYVDIGAHHPERFSVTKLLYDNGWSGINVDVTPEITTDFQCRRPRDMNIQALIGESGEATFFRFEEEALNTTDATRAQDLVTYGLEPAIQEEHTFLTLAQLLDNCDAPSHIDLLSVDVEGGELAVLESCNWSRYRFSAILVEIGKPLDRLSDDPVIMLLGSHGFRPAVSFLRSVLLLSHHHPGFGFFREGTV